MYDSSKILLTLSKNEKNQINNFIENIFAINRNNQEGIALFYKIKIQDLIYLCLLITNNYNIEIIKKEKKEINLSLSNLETKYILSINNNRKIYFNSKLYNLSMIEIKPEDNINEKYIFDINNIINIKLNDIYINKRVYLIKSYNGKNIEYLVGIIKNINENNFYIKFLNDIDKQYIGAPIINLEDSKIIGIYAGFDEKFNLNKGIYIKEIFDKFSKELKEYNNNNEITIVYKITQRKIVRLFGKEFVENNKDNCKIIIEGKEYDLSSHFNIENIKNKNRKLTIKLKIDSNITNISGMFAECSSLLYVLDISKLNKFNITMMKNMFYGCSNLVSLSDISTLDINNVTNIKNFFYGCSSLTSLPDISNWSTGKITNIKNIFSGCSNLSDLPDISKWNTDNIIDIEGLFNECSSLISLPDISKWNTKNIRNMKNLFYGCSSLTHLPDISKWNTENVFNMKNLFYGCSSLKFLPDISIWNTKNVINIENLFNECRSLTVLPNISKWDISNVTNIKNLFYECSSLTNLM